MLEILAPPLRIILMAAFLILAKQGWFTWLTPESAHDVANQVMDFLVVATPAAYALWAAYDKWRSKQPKRVIEKAAELPQVRMISLRDEDMAASIPSGKVIP